MTTDTTHLSGSMLDYYAALAENMPNPRLRKHEREDTFICCYGPMSPSGKYYYLAAYSPTTNSALALPIIQRLVDQFGMHEYEVCFSKVGDTYWFGIRETDIDSYSKHASGSSIAEAALRALVAWKFPDVLPELVYEKEEK